MTVAELLKTITDLPLTEITLAHRLRPVSDAAVTALMQVIEEHGFTVPVIVRRTRPGFRLIDGAHRVAAMERLGRETIPVRAYTCTDAEARVLETTQNLAGAAMSPLDDAMFLAAYSAAYEELHPETRAGVAGGLARQGLATELSSFAEIIAEKRAITPRQVRKIVAAGRRISWDEAGYLRCIPRKLALKDIIDLGRIGNSDERSSVISMMIAEEAKTVSAARKMFKTREEGVSLAVKDPAEEGFIALLKLWGRLPKAAKRRFVAGVFEELSPLVCDEAAERDEAEVAALRADMAEVAAE